MCYTYIYIHKSNTLQQRGKRNSEVETPMPKPSCFAWIFPRKKNPTPTRPAPCLLPDDLVAEILSYLPIRTTTKFKSVSKSWRRLISHPHFISLQRRRWADPAVGFFHWNEMSLCGSTVLFQPSPASAAANQPLISSVALQLKEFKGRILSSSNGLFLVGTYADLFVWNPITKARVSIPQPSSSACYQLMMVYGLAASPDSDSFQIVGVFPDLSSPMFIYSSKRGTWRKKARPLKPFVRVLPALDMMNRVGPAFVGGLLYWLELRSILAFDLRSGRVRMTSLPRDDMVFKYVTRVYLNAWLGGFGGNLYFVYVSEEDIELWRLERREGKVEHWEKVMEAKGCGRSAPLFFDGRRIAFSAVSDEFGRELGCIQFYDTWCREWQGSSSCITYDDSCGVHHCVVPFYL